MLLASLARPVLFASLMLAVSCGARTPLNTDPVANRVIGCTQGEAALVRANPTVMFVLDRSMSMDNVLGSSPSDPSRWQALTNALATALPAIDNSVLIGALLFPASGARSMESWCLVPTTADLLPKTGNAAALTALMGRTSPGGATPTAVALDTAAQLLLGVRAATAARALVLATDGAPDCNSSLDAHRCRCVDSSCQDARSVRCLDDTRTVERIADFRSQNLPTYVIGIQSEGDTSFSDVLDRMAEAGGRPQTAAAQKYYRARSADELDSAVVAIRDQVGVCTYLTSSVPDREGAITLTLDGVVLSPEEEWTWGSKDNGEILLLGSACQKAAARDKPALIAKVRCGPADAA